MANLLIMVFLVISSRASGGEPKAFGYQFKSVLSGSMEPTFKTGSIIAVKPLDENQKASLGENDVITFNKNETEVVTHRIIDVIKQESGTLYVTKGDSNKDKDLSPVLSDNVMAIYEGFTIPYLGYVVSFAQSPKGTALLLIIPGILLLGYAALNVMQALKELERKTKPVDDQPNKTA
ncbi:signal peptidase I [Bacillus sp. RO3]|nr:signal peptidase I [Bacillus sp. RO3]